MFCLQSKMFHWSMFLILSKLDIEQTKTSKLKRKNPFWINKNQSSKAYGVLLLKFHSCVFFCCCLRKTKEKNEEVVSCHILDILFPPVFLNTVTTFDWPPKNLYENIASHCSKIKKRTLFPSVFAHVFLPI